LRSSAAGVNNAESEAVKFTIVINAKIITGKKAAASSFLAYTSNKQKTAFHAARFVARLRVYYDLQS